MNSGIYRMRFIATVILIVLAANLVSCKKFLDERPDKSKIVPQTVDDLQKLLDNYQTMNGQHPSMGWVSADDYYFPDDYWRSVHVTIRLAYIWDGSANQPNSYTQPYARVFNANVVLDKLNSLPVGGDEAKYNSVLGSALFMRAGAFFSIAELFSPPYSATTAGSPYGIPLRTDPNIEAPTTRSTVQETYDMIIADLKRSIGLLPAEILYKTRPSKAAAYGLLARVYLAMRDYENAGKYADSCLQFYDTLLDYGALPTPSNTGFPFKVLNDEVIFHWTTIPASEMSQSKIIPDLYNSFDINDARKVLFFRDNGDGSFRFRGNYTGTSSSAVFCGIATDEVYLIRAECKARANDIVGAMADLNLLLRKRWKNNGTFSELTASTQDEALDVILEERRKQLIFRGQIRWSDLRRLNQEEKYQQTLSREVAGQTYTLPANDHRYTLLIPSEVIRITGIVQNER